MKVLSVYYTHKPGGMCKRLYRLLNALTASGNTVYYLCLDKPPETLSPDVKHVSIPFPLKARSGLLFWGLFTIWCPIYIFFWSLKNRPDKSIAFGAYYSTMLAPTSLILRVPIFLFLRSLVFKIDEITGKPVWLRSITGLVDKLGIKFASQVVCMTESMQSEVEKFISKELSNVSILPNDIPELEDVSSNLRSVLDITADTFVVGTSGVLDGRKNIKFLLDCAKHLNEKPIKILFLIAGEGPLRKEYEKEAESIGLKNVKFLGWQEDMLSFYKTCHLIVHPSIHEGVPNSVLEPLALNIPVLASDIPELRELMQHEELLFSLNDSETLAKVIQDKVIIKEDYDELVFLCKEVANRYQFDWDTSASEIIEQSSVQ